MSLFVTFRVLNNLSTAEDMNVSIDGIQRIAHGSANTCPAHSAFTLTPTVDCAGETNAFLEYGFYGPTPSSATLLIGLTPYTGSVSSTIIEFTNVDLTDGGAGSDVELTIN